MSAADDSSLNLFDQIGLPSNLPAKRLNIEK